jgi:hypothetical protein
VDSEGEGGAVKYGPHNHPHPWTLDFSRKAERSAAIEWAIALWKIRYRHRRSGFPAITGATSEGRRIIRFDRIAPVSVEIKVDITV